MHWLWHIGATLEVPHISRHNQWANRESINQGNIIRYLYFLPLWRSESREKCTEMDFFCDSRGTDSEGMDCRLTADALYLLSCLRQTSSLPLPWILQARLPGGVESLNLKECLHFSLKVVLQIWRMSQKENQKKSIIRRCKEIKSNFKGKVSKRVWPPRTNKGRGSSFPVSIIGKDTGQRAPRERKNPVWTSQCELPFYTSQGLLMPAIILRWQKNDRGQSLHRIHAGGNGGIFLTKIV